MGGLKSFLYELVLEAVDKGYPDIIHFPHTIISIAQYRRWRENEAQPKQWLYDLVLSYWSHSQGGGCMGKGMLLGFHNINTFLNPKHLSFQLIGYLLTYWSPRNLVYKMVMQPKHPLRLFCLAMDSLDATTTTCALIDVGRKIHPKNNLLPYVVSVAIYCTGSSIRCLDAKSRGKSVKSFLAAPGSGVNKAVVLALLWWFLGRGQKRNQVLMSLSAIYTVLDLLEDAFGFDAFKTENFEWLFRLQDKAAQSKHR